MFLQCSDDTFVNRTRIEGCVAVFSRAFNRFRLRFWTLFLTLFAVEFARD